MDVLVLKKQLDTNKTLIGKFVNYNNMEKVYRKVGRRYVECGYNDIPDISDGIWLVSSKPYSKSYSSLFWKVGDLKRPVDVVTHASLQQMSDDLSKYLLSLGDQNSDEWKQAKEKLGSYLSGSVSYLNICASDLSSLFMAHIASKLEITKNGDD